MVSNQLISLTSRESNSGKAAKNRKQVSNQLISLTSRELLITLPNNTYLTRVRFQSINFPNE